MNETVADGIGDYKLKRSGEPTGFMKRFKETPPVIFGTDPNEFERRWIAYTETYLYTIRDYIRHVFGVDEEKANLYAIDFVTALFRNGKVIQAPGFGYYRFMLGRSVRRFVARRRKDEAGLAEKFRMYLYDVREAVTRHSGIDRRRMSRCLESGLVEHCICGKGKVRGLTPEQVRCWKLRRIDNLPRNVVAEMCGLTTRVVNYNCDKVGAFVRERGREILKALDII